METLNRTIKYFDIKMNIHLDGITDVKPKEGYAFTFYQDGDMDDWIKIELSAKEFITYEEGIKAWEYYFKRYEHLLYNRMIFLVDLKSNEKIGTATAFFNNWDDDQTEGYLHWVAIKRSHQGLGLSKSLIQKALYQSKALGYQDAKIPTQTTSPVACRIYLDMGATPLNLDQSFYGYQILKTLFDHPALDVPKLKLDEIYEPVMLLIDQKLKSIYHDLIDYDVDDEDMKILILRESGLETLSYQIDSNIVTLN